jgi:hypothetical protein
MAQDPTFAPAISQLHRAPLVEQIVTPKPTPGQGYALNEEGHSPVTTLDGTYTLQFVTISFDGGSVAAGATNLFSATAPDGTCNVGDFAFADGPTAAQGLVWFGGGPITTADTLPIRAYNPTGAGINPTATDITWAVFKAR